MARHTLPVFTSAIILAGIAAILAGGSITSPMQDGAWLPAADLLTGRTGHTATMLRSGKVLVVGGTDMDGRALSSNEIFDPQKNMWAAVPPMSVGRTEHTATLLADGRVLVAGGFGEPPPTSEVLATAEIYDPLRNRWTAAASMHIGRARQTATLLDNGDVLVVGGTESGPSGSGLTSALGAEMYDPRRNAWMTIGDGTHAVNGHSASRLPDGRVVVIGGFLGDGCPELPTRVYNPQLGNWTAGTSMKNGRWGHTATSLPGGKILVLGGMGGRPCGTTAGGPVGLLTTTDLYDSRHDTWLESAPMDLGRSQHTATLLPNGLVLVVGAANSTTARAELYDPTRNKWVSVGGPMTRYGHTATLLTDGRVLVAGGRGVPRLGTTLIFDSRFATSRAAARWLYPLALGVGLVLLAFLSLTLGPMVLKTLRRYRDADRWDTS